MTRPTLCTLIFWIVAAGPSGVSAATVLYDVDFSADTIGSAPTTGNGPFPRTVPSPNTTVPALGPGVVVGSAGPLDDQPVLFDQDGSSGIYQLHLDLPASNSLDAECFFAGGTVQACTDFDPLSTHFSISFDVVVLELAPLSSTLRESRFALILDAPSVRRLDFASDGTIAVAGGSVSVFDPLAIGSYEFQTSLSVTVDVNLALDEWATSINGTELYRDSFGDAINVTRLRFGLGTTTPGAAAIDNISILAVPEPGTALLLVMGLGLLALRSSTRRS